MRSEGPMASICASWVLCECVRQRSASEHRVLSNEARRGPQCRCRCRTHRATVTESDSTATATLTAPSVENRGGEELAHGVGRWQRTHCARVARQSSERRSVRRLIVLDEGEGGNTRAAQRSRRQGLYCIVGRVHWIDRKVHHGSEPAA